MLRVVGLGIRMELTELGGVDMLLDLEAGKLAVNIVDGSMEHLLVTVKNAGPPYGPGASTSHPSSPCFQPWCCWCPV